LSTVTTIPVIAPSTPFVPGGSSSSASSVANFGLSSLVGFALESLVVLALIAVVGVFVIIVVANRADPDPSGRRPQSVFLFAVSFVTITTSILGSAVVVGALVQLAGSHSGDITNPVARAAVVGGLITVVSITLLVAHLRRGLVLARADAGSPNPSRRVGQSYVSAVSFVAILSVLFTTVFSVYLLFSIVDSSVFGSFDGKTAAVRVFVISAYLGGAAGLVLWTHRNLVPPGSNILNRGAGGVGPLGAQPTPVPPLIPPVQ
jgi:hypothetical protein